MTSRRSGCLAHRFVPSTRVLLWSSAGWVTGAEEGHQHLCKGPHMVSAAYSFCSQSFKNIKAIFSSRAMQAQAAGRIWLGDHGFLALGIEPRVKGRSCSRRLQSLLLRSPVQSGWPHWLSEVAQDPGDTRRGPAFAQAPSPDVSLSCSSGPAASPLQELRSRAVRECVCHLPAVHQPLQVSASPVPPARDLGQPRGLVERKVCWCFFKKYIYLF